MGSAGHQQEGFVMGYQSYSFLYVLVLLTSANPNREKKRKEHTEIMEP